jgi:16S rRNA (guanine527-N7)-methyltransferase
MSDDDRLLLDTLAMIQARGPIGERSLAEAVAHADRFVSLIPPGRHRVVDLGSAGGLPALVIAWRRADVVVTMVERRQARADLLRRAVSALRLDERAEVITADVDGLAEATGAAFDVVTARSFGSPERTVAAIEALLAPDGLALVSEPPTRRDAEWRAVLAERVELTDLGTEQGLRLLRRRRRST